MDGLPTTLPTDPDALIALLKKQQREIDLLQSTLSRKDKTLAHRDRSLVKRDDKIRQLENACVRYWLSALVEALRSSILISSNCSTKRSC